MEDHGDVYATFMGVLLVPLEGRVATLRPTPRIVGVTVRSTDVFDLIDEVIR